MKKDIVVIGGGPAGSVAASTAKKNYPDKSVAIVRMEKTGLVPCGIPYIFGTFSSIEEDVAGTKPLQNLGVDFIFDTVEKINPETRTIELNSSEELEYDKLILATGSEPIVPPIPGKGLKGVYTIKKNKEYLSEVLRAMKDAEKVVVIGGGFIGVEVGDEIKKSGREVTIIEAMPSLLSAAFDMEFSKLAEDSLVSNGINLVKGLKVSEILGKERVAGVKLEDGQIIESDLVIFAVGFRPRIDLAKGSSLHLGVTGGIWTDEYMRTSVKDVFAAGDCVEHKCFFTRKPSRLMLASTAAFEARIAGSNLYNLKTVRQNHGNLGVFSKSFDGLTLGAAGLTESMAKAEGFEYIIGTAKGLDRHPGTFEDTSEVTVKLLFSKENGLLLGGQIAGGKAVGEMINIIGLGLQMAATWNDLFTMQIGSHPLLTASPTRYQLNIATENALSKLRTGR